MQLETRFMVWDSGNGVGRSRSGSVMRERFVNKILYFFCGRIAALRKGGRVVEGAPLLREYALIAYRGFKSLPFRQSC